MVFEIFGFLLAQCYACIVDHVSLGCSSMQFCLLCVLVSFLGHMEVLSIVMILTGSSCVQGKKYKVDDEPIEGFVELKLCFD